MEAAAARGAGQGSEAAAWRPPPLHVFRYAPPCPRRSQGPPDSAFDPRLRGTHIEQHLGGDFRFDEDYARFYATYSGPRKLPAPVEGRTLYQDVPHLYPNKLQQQMQQMQQMQQLQQAQQLVAAQQAAMAGGPGGMLSRGITPGEARARAPHMRTALAALEGLRLVLFHTSAGGLCREPTRARPALVCVRRRRAGGDRRAEPSGWPGEPP